MKREDIRIQAGCGENASWEEVSVALRQKARGWAESESESSVDQVLAFAKRKKGALENQAGEMKRQGVPQVSPKWRMHQAELAKWSQRLEVLSLLEAEDRFKAIRLSLQQYLAERKPRRAELELNELRRLAVEYPDFFDRQLLEARADFEDTSFHEAGLERKPALPPTETPPPTGAQAVQPAVSRQVEPVRPTAPPSRPPPPETPAVTPPVPTLPPPAPVPIRIPAPVEARVAPRPAISPFPSAKPPPSAAPGDHAPATPAGQLPGATPTAAPILPTGPAPVAPAAPAAPTEAARAGGVAPLAPTPAGPVHVVSPQPTAEVSAGALPAPGTAAAPPSPPAPVVPRPSRPETKPVRIAIPVPPPEAGGPRVTLRKPPPPPTPPERPPVVALPPTAPLPISPPPAEPTPAPPTRPPLPATETGSTAYPTDQAEAPATEAGEPAATTEAQELRGDGEQALVSEPALAEVEEAPRPAPKWPRFVLTFVLLTLIASGGIWVSQNFSRVRELPGKLLGPRLFVEPQNQDVGRDSPVEWRVRVTSFATPSYQWYYTLSSNTPARALPNATQELYRLGPVQAGDEGFYAVVVSNRWGAMTSRWARLDVKVGPPGLDPDQPADQEVNPGQDAQFQIGLSITGPVKVQWYREGRPLAGETNTLLVVRGATGPEAADYSAVVMNRSGSVTSRIAQLRVRVPPALVEQPQSQPASAGRRVELAARATGSEPLTYQWRTRSGPVPNGRSARLTFSRVEPEQAGDYCVVVSNPAGSQTSQWATLTVSIPPPTITREPVAQEVNEGGEAVFSIQVDELNGWGPFNFQWSRDGQALAGATGRELRLASVKLGQAGDYAVRVSNASASAISQPARLTVRPPEPPKILSPPRSQTVKAGRSAELAVEVTGAQPISYQWYQDARLLPGQTKATLSITNAQLTHTGTYTLTVKNHLGTVSSPGTRLAVTPNLELDVHPQSTGSPRRSTVVLEARAVGDEPIGIQWHKNNRAVPGATGPTLRLSPLNPSDAGDYYVVVTNRIQALTSRHAQLTVTEPPPIKWTNSLGMVFVSVPKLDVLFCIWQTRVRDFDEFARISPHDGGRPGLMTWAPDHPVTRASWLDAQAFYGWLNDKERRLPKPVPGGLYRLPTDEEWSVAVGLAEPLGATPQARDVLKPTDLYPFSTGAKGGPWPPPAGAGNYADRTAKNSHRDWIVIDNYDDGFPETAPVQSFSANAHGLFGLGHNVREWCEDWWDAQKTERVIRGASYRSYQPLDLLSGTRTHGRPDTRLDDLGFRLVITLPAQK